MATSLTSFFDDPHPDFKLWNKNVAPINTAQEQVVAEFELLKFSKRADALKLRHFKLTPQYLYYFKEKSDDIPKGALQLSWVRCLFVAKEQDSSIHGIRFIKNGKYTDVWSEDQTTLSKLKPLFAKYCILCDFHNKFTAQKMIGKGSFARVYLVEEHSTKHRFAVKAFSKEFLVTQDKGREALVNEIEIMKSLNHPHIMKLVEIHESQNSIYLILELLEGGELLSYLSDKRKGLKLQELTNIIRQILEALAYIDRNGIMHRDLKPENMILKHKDMALEDNQIKIVDFGLATKYDLQEYMFKRCGTPGFVAPEVINAPSKENIRYNAKCDVYSAGIIFYLMITGRAPFEGKSFGEILAKNRTAWVDYDHPNLEKVPEACVDLLKKMLTPDPILRLSADECLQHEFLLQQQNSSSDLGADINEGIDLQLKVFHEKYKSNFKGMKMVGGSKQMKAALGMSIEFKVPGEITGTTNSYQDSVDFDPVTKRVDSLHFVNSAKPQSGQGLASQLKLHTRKDKDIYKAALISGLKGSNPGELDKLYESVSMSEGTVSDEPETRDDSPNRKSKFGPKV